MGENWFGQDVDEIFAYQTPRIAKIKDRTLGVMKNILMLLIFVYIFIFNIWYKGSHFRMSSVNGLTRLQWQEPTKGCNPLKVDCTAKYNNIKDLPYCTQYKGSTPSALQKPCDYYDARELPITMQNGVLLPTFYAKYQQTRACPRGAPTCEEKWKYLDEAGNLQTGTGYAEVSQRSYVADSDDFTLLLDHTFRTSNGLMNKDDFEIDGYYQACETCEKKPIKCVHKKCAEMGMNTQGAAASFLDFASKRVNQSSAHHSKFDKRQRTESMHSGDLAVDVAMDDVAASQMQGAPVISITDGDVISLATLMKFAGVELDKPYGENPADMPVRYRGIALQVNIEYQNLERWTLVSPSRPWYTITVNAMPSDTFKHATTQEVDGGKKREVILAYGTMIIVTQSGRLAFFDPLFGLIAFTTALALIAVSTTLTEMMMLYVLPRADEYKKLKFLESADFNEKDS